jgi:hypothetical protein
MCSQDTASFIQNIIYNWDVRGSEANHTSICNYVANFHHTGPATNNGLGKNLPYFFGDECATPIAGGAAGTDSVCIKSMYVAADREWFYDDINNDTTLPGDGNDYWAGADSIIGCRDETTTPGYINAKPRGSSQECANGMGQRVPDGWKSASLIQHEAWAGVPDTTAMDSTLIEEILAEIGNSQRIQCDGTWTSRRDSYDSSRVAWLHNNWLNLGGDQGLDYTSTSLGHAGGGAGTGVVVPDNPATIGGDTISTAEYAPADGGAWCNDTDGDGIPDEYEISMSDLSEFDANDVATDSDGDGWLAIEEYLNGTSSDVFTNPDGSEGAVADPYTYVAGPDTVWVRRVAATDQPIYTGSTDSVPTPTDWSDIPTDVVSGELIDDTFTSTARVLNRTCYSSAEGVSVLDSATFRDSASAAGLDPDSLMAISPVGCD